MTAVFFTRDSSDPFPSSYDGENVSSFEECVTAGNPILESYPRQCRVNDQTFTEDIGNELEKIETILIQSPRPNQTVTSPITIAGQARGSWYFEGIFSVELTDANGNSLGKSTVKAIRDWQTEEFVAFSGILTFSQPTTKTGKLILNKANPSGLEENEDALHIPVKF